VTLAGIARVVAFYLFLALIVFTAPGGMFLSYTIICLASLLFILASQSRPRPGNPLPGLAIGTLAMAAAFALILLSGGASVAGVEASAESALFVGVLIQLFVAAGEELSFRGYLLEDLKGQFGLPAAIALSSAGFALLHIHSMLSFGAGPLSGAIAMANITAAGALLALLALRWGLLSAMGFHFAWNFLQYSVFGLGLSGEFASLLRLSQGGNVLLTGGEYGPEASLAGTVVIFATLGIVWYVSRGRPLARATEE
jgi:membrane protease YdiL (CAAX protease family)